MDNEQPLRARNGRRHWLIGATVGCLLVAAAIIMAGVLGSQRTRQQQRPSGGMPPASTSDNILEALAQLNTMPMPRADEQAEASAVAAGSDAGPTTGGAPAGMTFADTGPVEGSSTPFETLKDLIIGAKAPAAGAVAPPGSLTTGGWAAIGGGRNVLCYPKNGTEVVEMSGANSACTIIVLTRSSREPYTIKQTINITTTKVFVGNPIDMPALNSSKIERLFYGEAAVYQNRWVQSDRSARSSFTDLMHTTPTHIHTHPHPSTFPPNNAQWAPAAASTCAPSRSTAAPAGGLTMAG